MDRHFLLENIVFRKGPTRSTMKIRIPRAFIAIVVSILAFSITVSAQTTRFMSVDEVRAGMHGVRKTVFQGTKVDEYDVEVLGLLKNFAPKQDMILARLSGGPLSKTGVIAGMSGSPVYVDGKLVGAVAFSFPYATEPIAGIQPIQQMLDVWPHKNVTPPQRIAKCSA